MTSHAGAVLVFRASAAVRVVAVLAVAALLTGVLASPASAADTSVPTLLSFSVTGKQATPGSTVTINYEATDDSGLELQTLIVEFTDPVVGHRSVRHDGGVRLSGSMSLVIGADWPSGSYELSDIYLFDQGGNGAIYQRDGTVLKGPVDAAGPASHGLDFSTGDFSVSGSTADFSMPTLIGFSVSGRSATPGSTVTVDYEAADDSGLALQSVIFEFAAPLHRTRQIRQDTEVPFSGSISYVIPEEWPSGAYSLRDIHLVDHADNRAVYGRDGTVTKSPDYAKGPTSHGFDLSTGNVTVSGSTADTSVPTLSGFSVSGKQATYGSTITIDYEAADDSGQPLETVMFEFTEPVQGGTDIRLSGAVPHSGSMRTEVWPDWPAGTYQLSRIHLVDLSFNTATYARDGVIYKDPDGAVGPTRHDLDLAAGDFTVSAGAAEPDPSGQLEVAPAPRRAEGVTRLAGSDRFTTAATVSQGSFPGTAKDIFMVTGMNWPDALSAGPAAAKINAPVLPVQTSNIPIPISQEIARLQPLRAWVVGGASVVSDSVLDELRARGIETTRVSGTGRYETAAAVADRFFPNAAGAYYASGAGYADALGGGAAAAERGWPLLLTAKDTLPAATPKLGSERIVLGGPAAISEAVRADLAARRVAGTDRFSTAAAIARDAFPAASVGYLATGLNFPDALAGAPAAARDNAPLLLARKECVTAVTRDAFTSLGITSRVVLGGTAVISDAAATLTIC